MSTISLDFLVRLSAVVEDGSHNPGVMGSKLTKTFLLFFFKKFHMGSYFEVFQTKWVSTLIL